MTKRSKRYRGVVQRLEEGKEYSIDEAVRLVKEMASVKFVETIDIAIKLGIDPRKSEQMVRGSVVLPSGTGKKKRIIVFAKGEKVSEAKEAGADYVGAEDLIEKINKGWFEFDAVVATPDMMKDVGKLGKILGPRGLMPSPKTGTVTFEITNAVKEIQAGKIDFRIDKGGVIHAPIGRADFNEGQLVENILAFIDAVIRAKPPSAKGQYLRKVHISSTMGPGVKIQLQDIMNKLTKTAVVG
ncbi:MAG: 50S ribosomal protein L1 [bacterium]